MYTVYFEGKRTPFHAAGGSSCPLCCWSHRSCCIGTNFPNPFVSSPPPQFQDPHESPSHLVLLSPCSFCCKLSFALFEKHMILQKRSSFVMLSNVYAVQKWNKKQKWVHETECPGSVPLQPSGFGTVSQAVAIHCRLLKKPHEVNKAPWWTALTQGLRKAAGWLPMLTICHLAAEPNKRRGLHLMSLLWVVRNHVCKLRGERKQLEQKWALHLCSNSEEQNCQTFVNLFIKWAFSI